MKLDVRNPRTGQVDHVVDVAETEQVTATVAALRGAQPAWEARGVTARAAVLAAFPSSLKP